MSITTEALSNLSVAAIAVGAAFITALWLSIIFYVIKDIRSRSRDPLLALLSILLVIVLFIPGVLIYWIIRPSKTIEQKYQAALEEEALLRDMEKQPKCPGCSRNISDNWLLCPHCHTKLKKKCVQCGKLLELQWNICPFCGNIQQKPYNKNIAVPNSDQHN